LDFLTLTGRLLSFLRTSTASLLAFAATDETLVGLPRLCVEDEQTAGVELLEGFQEEGLYARVSEVKMDPLNRREAQDDVEALLCCARIFNVVLASEVDTRP